MQEIGIQLYSVRGNAAKDFAGTIRQVAEMGYKVMEPAGFPGSNVEDAATLFKELGVEIVSFHGGLPLGENKNRIIDEAQTLGAKYIISGFGPDNFKTEDAIKASADTFNQAAAVAAEHGLQVGYHNHDWEMFDVNGTPGYRIFLENTEENVLTQLDTYWVKVGGQDPVSVLKEVGERAKVIHIKDGPCVRSEPMTAVGSGKMDFPPIIAAATCAEALIVELDSCGTDMMEAVKQSYDYLKSIV